MRDKIIALLKSTERKGIDNLIQWMDDNGFFTAPCSSQYHLCKEGGLAEHSLNVFFYASKLNQYMGSSDINEITFAALLHDLGKCGQFGKQNYIPNIVKDGRVSKADPIQKYKQSTDKPFKSNPDILYVDHEIRSIQIASQFIELTEEESFSILYHNGLYVPLGRSLNGKERPLQMIVHFADLWCSRVVEKEEKGSEE